MRLMQLNAEFSAIRSRRADKQTLPNRHRTDSRTKLDSCICKHAFSCCIFSAAFHRLLQLFNLPECSSAARRGAKLTVLGSFAGPAPKLMGCLLFVCAMSLGDSSDFTGFCCLRTSDDADGSVCLFSDDSQLHRFRSRGSGAFRCSQYARKF